MFAICEVCFRSGDRSRRTFDLLFPSAGRVACAGPTAFKSATRCAFGRSRQAIMRRFQDANSHLEPTYAEALETVRSQYSFLATKRRFCRTNEPMMMTGSESFANLQKVSPDGSVVNPSPRAPWIEFRHVVQRRRCTAARRRQNCGDDPARTNPTGIFWNQKHGLRTQIRSVEQNCRLENRGSHPAPGCQQVGTLLSSRTALDGLNDLFLLAREEHAL
jgi:hypothetical protein